MSEQNPIRQLRIAVDGGDSAPGRSEPQASLSYEQCRERFWRALDRVVVPKQGNAASTPDASDDFVARERDLQDLLAERLKSKAREFSSTRAGAGGVDDNARSIEILGVRVLGYGSIDLGIDWTGIDPNSGLIITYWVLSCLHEIYSQPFHLVGAAGDKGVAGAGSLTAGILAMVPRSPLTLFFALLLVLGVATLWQIAAQYQHLVEARTALIDKLVSHREDTNTPLAALFAMVTGKECAEPSAPRAPDVADKPAAQRARPNGAPPTSTTPPSE